MVPQKHKEAKKFIYNSGFYITTNIYPDFGEGLDGEAIKKRLKIFETKYWKQKDTSVTGNSWIMLLYFLRGRGIMSETCYIIIFVYVA